MFEEITGEPWVQVALPYWPYLAGVAVVFLVIVALKRLFRKRTTFVILDGSNVMYWHNRTPKLKTVRLAVDEAIAKGYVPVVWFDANVGYLVSDSYMGPGRLANELGLSAKQVLVSPRGTPADPLILQMAKFDNIRIITNDRYRDWEDDFEILRQQDLLVRGHWSRGRVHLKGLPALS